MKRSRWTYLAQADLARVDDHYAALAPDYADRVGRSAIAAARFLTEHPHAGPAVDGPVRKWRVPSTDYVLLYLPTEEGVAILRLHHGREDWQVGT